MSAGIERPIEQSVTVHRTAAEAFRSFTDFGGWWPHATHSVGGSRVSAIVFERWVGGKIYEQHINGRRFQWGVVQKWDPPHSVVFTWHPSREESTAQIVAVQFVPEGRDTHVTLSAGGWDRWGDGAARARRGYNLGWRWILNRWAGIGGPWMWLVSGLTLVAQAMQWFRGGAGAGVARARGELRAP
jgi:uncharacterized protein YndB with AHSA1/START domain